MADDFEWIIGEFILSFTESPLDVFNSIFQALSCNHLDVGLPLLEDPF